MNKPISVFTKNDIYSKSFEIKNLPNLNRKLIGSHIEILKISNIEINNISELDELISFLQDLKPTIINKK